MINLVVSLIECRSCSKQYVGSTTTPFRNRFNNYKNGARKVPKVYPKKCNVYQEEFHRQFNFLRDIMGRRTGRLLSLIGLKRF